MKHMAALGMPCRSHAHCGVVLCVVPHLALGVRIGMSHARRLHAETRANQARASLQRAANREGPWALSSTKRFMADSLSRSQIKCAY